LSNINRRGFLQVVGAAGLAPFLPAMSTPTAVAGGGASASKALWASLYANSGSVSEFVAVAKNMGLSNTAIQGVSARSIGVRVALAASTETLTNVSANKARMPLDVGGENLEARSSVRRALDHCFSNETDETEAETNDEVETLLEEDLTENTGKETL